MYDGTIDSDDGDVSVATFNLPGGLVVSRDESVVYVADSGNHLIRAISVAEDVSVGGVSRTQGSVSTLVGSSGVPGDKDSLKVCPL